MRLTRADKSVLSDWWFTVDRLMFFGLLLLIVGAGLVLSLAASPPIAAKTISSRFTSSRVRRRFSCRRSPSCLRLRHSRRNRSAARASSYSSSALRCMVATMFIGPEIKGARRWLQIGFVSIQPSEFVKPAFVVLTAWLFNESQKRNDVPGLQLALGLYGVFALLLVLQPDFGQTLLVSLVWRALFFMAGINLFWIGALAQPGLPASPRPIFSCRTWPRASTASSIPPPATPIRSTRPSTPSCMAAGSGAAQARAR